MLETGKKVFMFVLQLALTLLASVFFTEMEQGGVHDTLTPGELGGVLVCNWICFYILLYPFKSKSTISFESGCALVTGIAWLAFGPPMLAPFWGTLMYVVVQMAREIKERQPKQSWFITRIILIVLAACFYSNGFSLMASFWFLAVFALIAFFSIALRYRLLAKKSVRPSSPPEPPTEPVVEQPGVEQMLYALEQKQQSLGLSQIRSRSAEVIDVGKLMIKSMHEDSQDVAPGTAFLERYLVHLEKIIDHQLAMEKLNVSNAEFAQSAMQALNDLLAAFKEQHLRLQENNLHEMAVDLSVLNSLLKIEGFK